MKKNKGITLIALVITIILLLILTGVILNLALGNEGLLQLAKNAKNEYQNAEKNELKDLDKLYSSILIADNSQVTLSMQQLDAYIESKVEEKVKAKMEPTLNLTGEAKALNTTYVAETNGLAWLRSSNYPTFACIYVYDSGGSVIYTDYLSGVGHTFDSGRVVFVPKGCSWQAKTDGKSSSVVWFSFE